MALSANTALVQVLEDSTKKTVVKLVYHADTAADESDVLKVNVATLSNRTQILHVANSNAVGSGLGFVPDELVTANSGTGATGRVLSFDRATGNLAVVLVGANTFSNTDTVFGTRTINGAIPNYALDDVVTPTYLLTIESINWNVSANAKAELEWANSTGFLTATTLTGSGYYGRNQYGPPIPNNIASPNGNLYVSTHGVGAKGGYTIVIELRKDAGFSSRSNY